MRSRIFWRIAAVIFVSILLIEGALLLYSWFLERDRQFSRVEDSLATIVSMLDQQEAASQINPFVVNHDHGNRLKLTAYSVVRADGTERSGGDTQGLEQRVNKENPRHFVVDSGVLTSYLEGPDGRDKYWFQTDASWINHYMRNYVLRILVMVMTISLFVTGACLIFLSPLLVNPLNRLDRLLVRSEQLGIQSARLTDGDLARKDELGRVFRSFEQLRHRLLSSESENSRITKRFESFANMGADCFWETDAAFRFTYVAGDVKRLLKQPDNDFCEHVLTELLAEVAEFGVQTETLLQSLEDHGQWTGPVEGNDAGTAPVFVRILCERLTDKFGQHIGYRGTINDISKETKLAAELKHQANHDVLTGLPNRRALTQQLSMAINEHRDNGVDFSLLILDLDRFKTVNDSCGHTAGDMLIKRLAKQMEAAVGEYDTVARIGGDEFALLLRASNATDSKNTAERVRNLVENFQFHWNDQTYRVSASIGVAQADTDMDSQEALIFAADSCCLKAKQHGKNQVQVFSVDDKSVSLYRDEALWIGRILSALDSDDFVLFRQSIVPVTSHTKEDHFEILIRMRDADGGFWPPNMFLGAAERNNLMPLIDQWVVNQSLAWLAEQTIADDVHFCMNINLSGASLSDVKFREFLFERVKSSKQLNRFVCFEVTETVAMVNFDETVELLNELKSQGCQVALDDFGTGFSSLSHIRDLPLDYIKIDGVFISNILDSELDQTVVSSVADLARVLGIKTVAEFVDSEKKLKKLESMNIDYAQGFLFSKPEELTLDDYRADQADAA